MFRIPLPRQASEVMNEILEKYGQQQIEQQRLAQEQQYRQAKLPYEVQHLIAQTKANEALAKQRLSAEGKSVSPIGKAIEDVNYIAKVYGTNHEYYKQGLAYLTRLAEGPGGVELKVDPKTGAVSFTQGRGTSGIQQQIVNGQLVQKPSSPTTNIMQKQQLANVSRIKAFEDLEHPYIGEGSNKKIINDYIDLTTNNIEDPKTKKETEENIIKAAVSWKMIPEVAALQLESQGVRSTVSALEHQKKALKQGWPVALDFVVNNLPAHIQKEVNKRHSELLTKLKEHKEQYFAKGMPIPLNQENQNVPQTVTQAPENITTNVPSKTPKRKYSDEQLNRWALEAIAKGKKKKDIEAKMKKLKKEMVE